MQAQSDLPTRLRRICASIGQAREEDPSKLRAKVISTPTLVGIEQDFRGGLSQDDLENLVHNLIHNIANLGNHLRKWAKQNNHDRGLVDEAIRTSRPLQIMIDLSNNDKHGYPPRESGRSGLTPRLVNINRVMELRPAARKGSTVGMQLCSDGTPRILGDGRAAAVITGDVVDKNQGYIGDLSRLATEAVEQWEHLLKNFRLLGT